MAGPTTFFLLVVLLQADTFFLSSSAPAAMSTVGPDQPAPCPATSPVGGVRGGYYPSWLRRSLPPSAIELSYFTHVFYAFVQLDPASYELVITSDDAQLLPDLAAALHRHCPPRKALLSIGGGNSGADTFAELAGSPSSRSAFIASTIAVARRYGLDGLDLDWEFPRDPEEMDHLGLLFREWRSAVEAEAARTGQPRLLLTSAVYFASSFFVYGKPRSYPVEALRGAADFVNLMCYDYRGDWDTSATGAHAALYDPGSNVSTSYGVGSWVGAGMPAEKLVMGVPLYGKSWRLKDPAEHGVGAPAVGTGPGRSGVLTYAEVVKLNARVGATEVYDEATVSEYSYSGTDWVGYDGVRSVTEKMAYARRRGLGGYFFWALGYDKDWEISSAASDAWGH
uniref:Acidic mammalian chitinase n=1 Tax=Anthurium amnicola TaxID=1678845 RepID=A0A1D1Z6E7_9ARAE